MKSYNPYLNKTLKKNLSLKEGLEFEAWLLELSLNIARLRKAKGYSQEEFAERLGMSQSSVARIEAGQNMRCSTIWKISDALEADLEIFDTSKSLEKEKMAYFYEQPSKVKEAVGATAEADAVVYSVENIPSLNLNLHSNAIAY